MLQRLSRHKAALLHRGRRAHVPAAMAAQGLVRALRLSPAALMAALAGTDTSAEERSFDVGGYDRVRFIGEGDLRIVQGGAECLRGRGSELALDRVKIERREDELVIRTRLRRGELRMELGVKDLSELSVAGDAEVETDALETPSFALSGAGDAEIDIGGLDTDALTVRNAGDTVVKIAGRARDQSVRVTGDGEYSALELLTETSDVRVSGDGWVEVNARDALDVRIFGDGRISYRGNPRVSQRVMGHGSITPVD